MSEPMSLRVETWPVAADETGVWLISGDDAWRSRLPVMADGEPHADAELLLYENGALDDAALIHSTSWRVDQASVLLTYMVVVQCNEPVRDRWPSARPISLALPDAVGKPPTNAANEPPAPRYIDVLMHGLRHLRFLLDHDATAAAVMNASWRRHLTNLEPALAGMYDQLHHAS